MVPTLKMQSLSGHAFMSELWILANIILCDDFREKLYTSEVYPADWGLSKLVKEGFR